ncbi:hypothetical protein Tc00.1047053511367.30 [Trypanosoma cruzi]|uniref:Uncharacterized protein n=1 Tax=Trypanosoma cruzi (strain CL Brener) TaxID=353153 RepID=Q4DYI9_TRYCC|nr:hypothetical protein Tc00.1047053511367.30 [Trypanosoma cruzi]EAN97562.1 hypothetical protein Tc00.1047053511367.30 [Trypanosoma cruzi]|eukprot:XP_819413.1 hypothetical protein [Trypanosoma cruzi strain CL Brener]
MSPLVLLVCSRPECQLPTRENQRCALSLLLFPGAVVHFVASPTAPFPPLHPAAARYFLTCSQTACVVFLLKRPNLPSEERHPDTKSSVPQAPRCMSEGSVVPSSGSAGDRWRAQVAAAALHGGHPPPSQWTPLQSP